MELSKSEQKGIDAHNIAKHIAEAKQNIAENFLLLGQLLSIVRKKQIYRTMGYEKFEHWLSDPDICMSYPTASRLINIWEIFVEHYKQDPKELKLIDFSKMAELLPAVRDKKMPDKKVLGLLNDAKSMTMRDLRVARQEAISGHSPEECDHDWQEKVTWRCQKCHTHVYSSPYDE